MNRVTTIEPSTPLPMSQTMQPESTPAASVSRGAADPYLRTRVMTASPAELQMMMYDGAIRFAEQGKTALHEKTYDRSYEKLTKAQLIVNELQASLRPEQDPETCRRLKALYTFIYLRLVDANIEHEVSAVDDALQVLRYQRETWSLLMKQQAAAGESAAPAGRLEHARTSRLSLAG